jgi:hypothetical protein
MTDESSESPLRKPGSTHLYFLTLYLITVGILYLWGYWSSFNVNILEYLSLTDVIRWTAYPIATAFGFLAIGALLGEYLVGQGFFPVGAGRNSRTGKFLGRFSVLLAILYVVVLVALALSNAPNKWRLLSLLLATPIYLFAKNHGLLLGLIPNDSARSVVIFLLALLPTFAYGQGRLEAEQIMDGRKFDYALSPIDQVSSPADANPNQKMRYLGHAGDFFFFLNPASHVLVITKFQDDKALLLKHFDVALERPPAK